VAASPWKKVFSALIPLLLVPGDVTPANARVIEPPTLCCAFLKGNAYQASDLYVACEGKNERITKVGDIWDFAVAADGSALALRRQRGTETGSDVDDRPIDIPHFEIEVVSLKADFQRRWSPVEGDAALYPYCGAILAVVRRLHRGSGGPPKVTYRTYNVLTGQPLSLAPYVAFGCSADKKTVAGYLDVDRHTLWAGMPPQRRIVQVARDRIVYPYDISPNGRYVAYAFAGTGDALCVDENGENLGCLRGWGAYPQKISISDAGRVLCDSGTGDTCGGWECMGILYWRPGNKEPKTIQPVGWFAQWITPEVAVSLRAWSSHENASGGKSPK